MRIAQFRSEGMPHITRNGETTMNPYHFAMGEDAEESQQLAIAFLDKIYDTPIEEQPPLTIQYGGDKTGLFHIWYGTSLSLATWTCTRHLTDS
jgi:hypothetical protein